jgi:hypothetical protein
MRKRVSELNESMFLQRGMSWRFGSEPLMNVVGYGNHETVYENWNVCISFFIFIQPNYYYLIINVFVSYLLMFFFEKQIEISLIEHA